MHGERRRAGSTFDAPVTINDVDGTDYTVSVEVAEKPQG